MARILFVINDLGLGGAQKVFTEDAQWLASLGFQVTILTLYAPKVEGGESFVPVNAVVSESLFIGPHLVDKCLAVTSLRRFIQKGGYTHVVSTLDEANIITRLASVGIKEVLFFAREANEAEGKGLKVKAMEFFLSLFPVKIIAVSQAVKLSIVSYLPWMEDRIVVLNNGILINESSTKNGDEAKVKGEVQILSVGSLTTKKNQALLVRAFALVLRELEQAQSNVSVKLALIGGGDQRNALQKLVRDLGIEGRCLLVGKVAPQEVTKWYQSSDIFALSSQREGSPNVILEAMHYCLPVVTTLVGSAGEMVENGKTGFSCHRDDLTSFAQGLLALVKDSALRERMGLAGRAKLEREYSIENHRSSFIKILGIETNEKTH